MAIKFDAVDVTATVPYIPRFAQEREKLEKNPDYPACSFRLRRLTERETESVSEYALNVNGAVDMDWSALTKIFIAGAVEIDNLSFTVDGKEQKITSGAEYAKFRDQAPSGLRHLIREVATELMKMSSLTGDDEKN